jgi:glutamate--cysteine ligase catalytic subunit
LSFFLKSTTQAFAVCSVLVTRVILAFDLNLYIPMSKVDENMRRAQKRDALVNEKFFFRRDIAPPQSTAATPQASAGGGAFEVHGDGCAICFGGGGDNGSAGDLSDEFEEMTALEILMGKVSKLTSL